MDTIITSILGSSVISSLELILENVTKAFWDKHFSESESISAEQNQAIQHAIHQAFEQWILSFFYSLQLQGYQDETLKMFFQERHKDIETFLQDSEMTAELFKPFFFSNYQIDSHQLALQWRKLKLSPLPEDFDTTIVNRAYFFRINKAGIITAELRDLFLAQQTQEKINHLKTIRNEWQHFDLDNYAKFVKNRYRVLDLSVLIPLAQNDIDNDRNDAPIQLQAIFIPQQVKENRPLRELPKEVWEQLYDMEELKGEALPKELRAADLKRLQDTWTQAKLESVLVAVSKPANKRLILLGNPGSGKSTLARYLLLSILEKPNQSNFQNPNNIEWINTFHKHLPLLVELRHYRGEVATNNEVNFLEYLQNLGIAQGYTFNPNTVKEQLKTHPSLVIFDGLDDIFDAKNQEKMIQEIICFADEYPQARIIITSRLLGYQSKALQSACFREYTLQDFLTEQTKIFVQRWFNLVYPNQSNQAEFDYQRIKNALQHSPAMRQLASNPWLLTMIVIIAQHQEFPKKRVKLYQQVVQVLCHHWNIIGNQIQVTKIPVDFMAEDDKQVLLRRIAWRMQTTPREFAGNFILDNDLHNEIENYLNTNWQLSASEIGHAMIEQLREKNFLFCFYGTQVYGFFHRTFLEYFCATEIVYRLQPGAPQELTPQKLKNKIFLAHYQDSAWHEILRLICGMVTPRLAGKLITAIVPTRKNAFAQTNDLILSVQCLAEVTNLNPIADVARQVLEGVCGWFEQPEKWTFDNLEQKEHHFEANAVPAIERIGKKWPQRNYFLAWLAESKKETFSYQGVYAFGRIVFALCSDEKSSKNLLIHLSNVTPKNLLPYMAFDALARCFGYFEDIRTLLWQRATTAPHWQVRSAAISTLAQHYTELPETLSLLQQVVQNDKEKLVRRNALSALAQHFTEHPETLSLLQKMVQNDEERVVRRAAVNIFAQYYTEFPQSLPLLQQIAQNDKDSFVRRSAIIALAQHYPNCPESLSLLQQIAQNDKRGFVRRSAIRVLARQHYTDTQAIRTLLLQILTEDKKADVRQEAMRGLSQYYETTWQNLLLQNYRKMPGYWNWLDPKELIDERRVEEAANQLGLSAKTVRQHYEDIATEIPLRLAWQVLSPQQTATKDELENDVRSTAVGYIGVPDTLSLLRQIITEEEDANVRSEIVGGLARNYYDKTWQKLLSRNFWGIDDFEWLDPKELIDEERIEAASKALNLSPETICQHYEAIMKEIPLLLYWKPQLLRQRAITDPENEVRRAAVEALVKYYTKALDTLSLLRQIIAEDEDGYVRSEAMGGLVSSYQDNTWQKLLSRDLDGIYPWLDSKAIIDEERIEEAAHKLELSPQTISQHYETIAKEIPLHLAWVQNGEWGMGNGE